MIRLACPSCKRNLRVKEELAGKRGVCPHCKERLTVPGVDPYATVLPGPNEQRRPLVATETLLNAAAGPPTVDYTGEALDFLAPAQTPNELGRLGTYRILRVLGMGGMGVVLHAEDLVLKRAVALKVMRSALAKSKDARQRFLREARAMAAIEHRHIVHIYQVAEDRGVPYLAMPFLKGESLETRLQRERRLPLAEAIRLARQIAEGLAAAHKNELIHRDIKPGNIWLETQEDPRDWVKLLDFGLARTDGEGDRTLTQLGTILGTPGYMAPEQARGEKVDARCDLFSLGAVLYRMLSGTLPFKGKDTMSQLMSLAEDTPRPVRELNADVPPPLADLVMQLLAKELAGRPSSARAVADTLAALEDVSSPPSPSGASRRQFTPTERAILEEPTRLVKPPAVVPARGGRPRSPWMIPLAVGGALLGLLVLGLLLSSMPKTPTTPASSPSWAKTTTPFPKLDKNDETPPRAFLHAPNERKPSPTPSA
jgi:serine/threonine protein kinase